MSHVRNKDGLWINTAPFNYEAKNFLKNGYYTAAPEGTEEHKQYWTEQWDRCVGGYEVGGVKITGEHYFYLNFCQIQLTKDGDKTDKKQRGRKEHYFPSFWDGDYEYFHLLDIATNGCTEEYLKGLYLTLTPSTIQGGKHVLVGKARRKGFSYKNAAKVAREYTFFRRSLSLVCAFNNEFAEVPMKMIRDYCNFLNEHTAFSKRRIIDKKDHIKSGRKVDVDGTPIEKGYLSEIMTLTMKDNPDAARGKDANLILMEEMGKWVGAKAAYSAIRPCVEDGSYVTGMIIGYGTGGDMEGGTIDFHEMFYSPEAYNLLAFNNIWDENAQENKCAFFFPAQQNLIGFVDEQGNSLKKEALEWIEEDRLQISSTAKDKTTLTQRITEYATNPMEAFSLTSGNVFPGPDLMKMLGLVESTKDAEMIGVPGEMVFNPMSGKPEFQANLNLQPADFPVKNTDDQGCIVMWERPPKEQAPPFTYLAGMDPYDQDKAANSVSLGSLIIMRKAHPKYGLQDKIVCEYTARPGSAEQFYETCRRLLIAYNAICLYENEKKGVFLHFKTHHSLQYLAYTPTYLKALRNTTVNRVYGLHMTPGIKREGEIVVKDWLETIVQGEDGKMNLHYIYSPAILKELIKYRAEGNFDRVIAILMLCILRMEYYNVIIEEKIVQKEDPFWSRKLVR